MILQCENHQKLTAWGIQPVLVLDVFEHAYYLKYQNRRNEYVNQLFQPHQLGQRGQANAGSGACAEDDMKWITRERPKIDRIACPWLVQRFIDQSPEFLFVPADQVLAVAELRGCDTV